MRVSEIAARLQAAWEGEGDREITGAAALESASAHEVAFVGSRKAAAAAAQSRAGCLLVTEAFPKGPTLIRVSDPRAAFAAVIGLLHPPIPVIPGIHPTAVIAPGADVPRSAAIGPHAVIGAGTRIGERSKVGAGCVLADRIQIGSDCLLHPNVTIYSDVTVGDRAVLHSGCVLGADGFGFVRAGDHYEKFPQIGRVAIGHDVEIGANSCVDRAALGVTEIGDGTKLDNLVHIGHNCRIGRHVVIAAQTGLSGGVVVEDYAVIGGQVGIGDKARIESGAVLGSGCGILTSKIIRKGQVVWGTPARPLKEHLEQLANLARLPELRKQVKELERRTRENKES
ncbi:MAG: UDP-3-O-(3-hydroxymyristoyl)glucosamine N-acyltransferase [Acidobacteriia bacterium]|nr:UDP-3-O-(3-hydroxymyristoyl)glucosamine N-acyltransferase [Terriglobia bacterium]